MMNSMPQLCNVCKYTGTKFRFNLTNRRWCTSKSAPGVVDRMKKSDGVDEKYQLIYRPPNSGLLTVATSFCSFSSVFCPSLLGIYAFDYLNERNVEFVEQVSNVELSGMGIMGIASVIATYVCTSMPIRIYNHEKDYIAILPSLIPLMNRKFEFKKGDIQEKNNTRTMTKDLMERFMEPGFEVASFYKIKNKRIVLTAKCFNKPIDFFNMFANTKKYVRKLQQTSK